MRLLCLSDLHREFAPFVPDPSVIADVVVLAGDIDLGVAGVCWAAEAFPVTPVVYVLGNHEFYRNHYPTLVDKCREAVAGSTVSVLENSAVTVGDVTFHGATLWTSFALFGNPRVAGYECQQQMTDYRKIRRAPGYSKMRSMDIALIHARSVKWLAASLSDSPTARNVVVTHHAPSALSLPVHRRDDLLSAAYASPLDDMVTTCGAELWVHGHVHHSADYPLGKTRVVCNPRGYIDEPNTDFRPGFIVEL